MEKLTPNMWLTIIFRLVSLPVAMALMLHWPAGNWKWLDGWLVVAALSLTSFASVIWLATSNPGVIIERLKGNFQQSQSEKDTIVAAVLSLFMLATFPIAGLDYRNSWLQLGLIWKIIGWLMYFYSVWLLYRVFSVNAFLSRSIVIQEERHQQVITTGPYAYIRHPMYFAVILFTAALMFALGSAIALIPAVISFILLYFRAVSEEELLVEELEGYEEYMKKVKHRIIPFLL